MRISSMLTHGAGLAGVLLPAVTGSALAAAGSGRPGTEVHAGTGENTRLHITPEQVHHSASGASGSGIIRTIIALIIVIALIYVVARVIKAVKGRDQRASGDGLSHLATLPLGQNKSLALVRSGQDIVLVGIAESGVTAIKTYSEAEATASGIIAPEPQSAERESVTPSFQGFLDSVRKMTVRA